MRIRLLYKIMLVTGSLVAVAILGGTAFSTWRASVYITDAAKSDLSHLTLMASQLCKLNRDDSHRQIESSSKLARNLFDQYSQGQVAVSDDKLVVGPARQGKVINDNFEFVDEVARQTGALCTIFQVEGDKAIRVATTVVTKENKRAVGTPLSQAVYDVVVSGAKSYQGRAWVVNDWCVTSYEPLFNADRKVVGVLFVGQSERAPSLRASMLSNKVGKTGYMYAIDSKGILQIHPAKEGADLTNYDFIKEIIAKGPKLADGEVGWITYPWQNKELGDTKARDKIVAYTYFKDWDWIIAAGSYLDEFTAPTASLRNANLMLGLVALLVALLACYLFARSLTRPITSLTEAAESLAIGDVDVSIKVSSHDELGDLATSFRHMISNLRETASQANSIADGDLRVHVTPRSEKDTVGHAFKTMVARLSHVISQVRVSAGELVSATTEVAASSSEMVRGSESQAGQVSEVSTAVSSITTSFGEINQNIIEATSRAKQASSVAEEGGSVVSETIGGMQRIADVVAQSSESIGKLAASADQIGEIVRVIDDIADQTNLLALNAAIEAARAGEQGRGFAVVADEVRKLAERTGKATKEISDMISGIQHDTKDAVKSMSGGIEQVQKGKALADRAGVSLQGIVDLSNQVTQMVAQIATATEQQAEASSAISFNMEQIAAVTRENVTGASQSSLASEELNKQAESLRHLVEMFKL